MSRFMLSGEASISPIYLTSPPGPASAIAIALRNFAASIPTKASLSAVIIRPPLKRTHSYPGRPFQTRPAPALTKTDMRSYDEVAQALILILDAPPLRPFGDELGFQVAICLTLTEWKAVARCIVQCGQLPVHPPKRMSKGGLVESAWERPRT
jgi:hypothetical protein